MKTPTEADEGEPCVWRVHRRSGGRNDREWDLIATGATPLEAVTQALALTGQQDQVGLTTPAVEGRGDRSEAIAYFEAFVKRKDEMDRMGYGLRAEEWPEFVATMRATLTGEGCGETYRNWHIRYDPPPIPSRASDWHFAHSDFDGAPDANDNRCGCAASLEAAKAEIDAWIEENFDCRCSAAIPADCMALTCKWRAT